MKRWRGSVALHVHESGHFRALLVNNATEIELLNGTLSAGKHSINWSVDVRGGIWDVVVVDSKRRTSCAQITIREEP